MKTMITSIALMLAITSSAQVSINAGLSSRFQGALKIAAEKQINWSNTELSTTLSLDNYHPVVGLQTGITTQNENQWNYRFSAGAFYHTGLLPVDKECRIQTIRFGGSIRMELDKVTMALEYNGETAFFTIGFLFKHK